jgi:hypothetical protein
MPGATCPRCGNQTGWEIIESRQSCEATEYFDILSFEERTERCKNPACGLVVKRHVQADNPDESEAKS